MKAGFLNNKCVKCLKILDGLENYGTTEDPLCFDCAYLIVKSGYTFDSVHKQRGLIHWIFGA